MVWSVRLYHCLVDTVCRKTQRTLQRESRCFPVSWQARRLVILGHCDPPCSKVPSSNSRFPHTTTTTTTTISITTTLPPQSIKKPLITPLKPVISCLSRIPLQCFLSWCYKVSTALHLTLYFNSTFTQFAPFVPPVPFGLAIKYSCWHGRRYSTEVVHDERTMGKRANVKLNKHARPHARTQAHTKQTLKARKLKTLDLKHTQEAASELIKHGLRWKLV